MKECNGTLRRISGRHPHDARGRRQAGLLDYDEMMIELKELGVYSLTHADILYSAKDCGCFPSPRFRDAVRRRIV